MIRYVPIGFACLAFCLGACKAGEAESMKAGKNEEKTNGGEEEKKVIDSPVAGSWYTSDGGALRREIRGYLDEADLSGLPDVPGRITGLISPHAGYRFSGKVEAHGYKLLEGKAIHRVIVLGPSHHIAMNGFALTDATHWRTPIGEVPIDGKAAKELSRSTEFQYRHDAFTREHSVDIQIPFIQVVAPEAMILPIVVGQISPEQAIKAGRILRTLLDGKTVLVASSDFTHYGSNFGYVPFQKDVEKGLKGLTDNAAKAIMNMDIEGFHRHVEDTGDTICGRAPIMTLLSAIPGSAMVVPLKFDTSGRMTGDWSNTVSYLSVALFLGLNRGPFQGIEVLEESEQQALLKLARETVRLHLSGKALPDPEKEWKEIPDRLRQEFGVFVTLKKQGNLRGCIGSILPVEPLFKGVIRNAINAASNDHRFRPMTLDEEPEVDIEISVLTPPEEVFSADDIRIGRDGVILEQGSHRAVFLPQVAPEQGWDLETTLTHLSMKSGLAGDAWKQDTRFRTFQAQVFHEQEKPLVH